MQKQTIYSYLQRSLVKILSKSTYSNEYKTTLFKPLKECCKGVAGYAKPIKKSKKRVPLATLIGLESKTLNFFRRVNSSFMPFLHGLGHYEHQSRLRFTCKFYLISFIRLRVGYIISTCYGKMLLEKTKAKQKTRKATNQKIIKLNQSLNNDQLLYSFLAKRLEYHFYPPSYSCNKKTVVCPSCFTCFCCLTYCDHRASQSNQQAMPIVTSTGVSLEAMQEGLGYTTKSYGSPTRRAQNTKAFLFVKPFEQKRCNVYTNFDVYDKQSRLLFSQSVYKRKEQSTDYRTTFQNLFYFFSFFSFTTNKEVCFFNSYELYDAKQMSFTRYAQQVLYLHKIEKQNIACYYQFLCFTSHNLDPRNTLQFLQNKTNIIRDSLKVSLSPKRQEMQCFSSSLFCFLTIIFYISIKYTKQLKEQIDDPFQPQLIKNTLTYELKKITDFNFISFKPFFRKVIVSYPAFNSINFFLMRPLFSLTRLDTFCICESLKLPIYPDKSNLRVDFLRNRIRKQILPAIRILLNPQFDTILCKFYE